MKRLGIVLFMIISVLPANLLLAQIRTEHPNDFSMEVGGRCGLYCTSYQRMFGDKIGLEVAVSYVGGTISVTSESVLFLSGGGRFYFLKKDVSPCLAAGVVYVTAGVDFGPLEAETSGLYFYASPGFEYRMPVGFLVRGTVNFLIQEGVFIVWPGVTLGISF